MQTKPHWNLRFQAVHPLFPTSPPFSHTSHPTRPRFPVAVREKPGLVRREEVDALREALGEVAGGSNRFVLQAGACAERFEDATLETVEEVLLVLLQMSSALAWGLGKGRVIRIGRLAGQYAKPRSALTEVVGGREVAVYRGDLINGWEASDREPSPSRLLTGYGCAQSTLALLQSVLARSATALTHRWDLEFVSDPKLRAAYAEVVALMEKKAAGGVEEEKREEEEEEEGEEEKEEVVVGGSGGGGGGGGTEEGEERGGGRRGSGKEEEEKVFVSHEGLHLYYEEALTRKVEEAGSGEEGGGGGGKEERGDGGGKEEGSAYYNLGAHMLWLGERTRGLDGAHVEYLRGIANPIGIKLSRSASGEEVVSLVRKLWPNPRENPGKVMLITRLGAEHVDEVLPGLIAAVQRADLPVVWSCDPMHGNTRKTADGTKTRRFQDILAELSATFRCHDAHGSRLAGLHVEVTGDHVTECLGGSASVREEDLPRRYTTYCDPRLNFAQATELALLVASHLHSKATEHEEKAPKHIDHAIKAFQGEKHSFVQTTHSPKLL